ncbi:Sporulation initiation inhibitor protein soj [Mycobacteroides abscessus subsp. abscessus]|nr:Sporulation initiation inhibitor protein soj [Mycobacteroides abscessus subsp. abscessus]
MYARYLERNFDNELDRVSFFKKLIEPLKSDYDFIFIDVPPTLSLLNDTAFYACDQIIVVLQTQERSLSGAEVFITYLQETLINEFHSSVDILGILPVLSKKGARVDKEILKAALESFGPDNVFENKISIMERIKRMDMEGVTDNPKDIHDRRVHEIFTNVSTEILSRLEKVGV